MATPITTPAPAPAPTPSPAPAPTPASGGITQGGQQTPQWTTKSFAASVRAKYPTGVANDGKAYSEMDDGELASRMVAKYPVYAKQISDFTPTFSPTVKGGNPVTDYASNLVKDVSDNSDSQKIASDIQRAGENFNSAGNPATKAAALLQGLFQVGGHVIGGAAGKIMAPLTAIGETAGQDSSIVQSAANSKPVNATVDATHPLVQGFADWATKHPDAAADLNSVVQGAGLAIGGPEAEGALNTVKEGVDTGTNAIKTVANTAKEGIASHLAEAVKTNPARPAAELAAQEAKNTKKGINIVSPELTGRKMDSVLATDKVKNEVPGKMNPFKTIKPDFSGDPHLHSVYQSVKDFINHKASTFTENLENVKRGISAVSEHEVKPHLEQHPVPFNFEDLRGYLDNVHPSSAIKADKNALENFNRTKEDILSLAEHHLRTSQTAGGKDVTSLTDVNDLWNPGKAIDSHIQNQLGESTLDTPQYTGIKAAATAMRNGFRGFMSDSLRYPGQMEKFNRFQNALNDLPANMREKMGPVEKEDMASQMGLHSDPEHAATAAYLDAKMSELARMFEARDNLARKARGEQGTSAYRRFMDEHPIIRTGARGAVRTAALGAGVHLPL